MLMTGKLINRSQIPISICLRWLGIWIARERKKEEEKHKKKIPSKSEVFEICLIRICIYEMCRVWKDPYSANGTGKEWN